MCLPWRRVGSLELEGDGLRLLRRFTSGVGEGVAGRILLASRLDFLALVGDFLGLESMLRAFPLSLPQRVRGMDMGKSFSESATSVKMAESRALRGNVGSRQVLVFFGRE